MTTTVTLTTHSWPAQVTTVDDYPNQQGGYTHTENSEIVPPDTTRVYHITSTRGITFDEMPLPVPEAENE